MTDSVTKCWMRDASDELAVRNGCKFDEERAQFVVDWIQHYCVLYEGEHAGQPMILRDWQLDVTMRMFGWIRWSDRWGRWVRRFQQASVWIAKKNKKSPTLAAWGLYLLIGDGEPGQKVFFAAKDGTQAREIAGKHAIEMLEQSPPLMDECTINRTLMQITHEPSRSILKPMSSSNKKNQQSKEGINGSVLIDETHVVDRKFIERINRAGISRSEPLHIEVSTAGDDPDGYGKERFDYAQAVARGEFEDDGLLVADYSAPQLLKDEELAADPVKYGRMANPAFGHTVEEEEFLRDYNRSKRSLDKMAQFKMYRLNIWQNTANPWLARDDWMSCREEFTAADLQGEVCFAGLDLSKTRDMTALVLVFPMEGEHVRLLPFFWMPEEEARAKNHLAPFLAWADAGYLTLTPGDIVDYGFLRSEFRDLSKQFRIQSVAYDPYNAEQVTQEMEQGVMDSHGRVIEEGTGVPRVKFPQTITHFAEPTAEFERRVMGGMLHHNGNPILTWQAGHVTVKHDVNNNKRPVKPGNNDIKKIDGIVGGIMGLGELMLGGETASVYRSRGVITIGDEQQEGDNFEPEWDGWDEWD